MSPREEIRQMLLSSGAVRVGFASADPVSGDFAARYDRWIAAGCHAGMDYLSRHAPLKRDLQNVLPGVKTVASLAFPYYTSDIDPTIARYAQGEDYHKALRRRLRPVCREIEASYGCKTRICIDSAPVPERYYAMQAGIGRLGRNGCVIVDGYGSFIFLTEVLMTMELEPDAPSRERCLDCGICLTACPGRALRGDGTIDARRCVSYITIEKRGEPDAEERRITELSGMSFGCDHCQQCCPHNTSLRDTPLPEFHRKQKLENQASRPVMVRTGR